jgi:lipoate-protein ligase A
MFGIFLESNDPWFNLATEEFLLHERKEDFLLISINDPSVIIGKHQVAHREVNTKFTEENNIPVIRRISGGGAVYHDRGNLNFAFIRQSQPGKQVDFKLYTQPVIDFLHSAGIMAVLESKNDLKVNGLKISGNAEHVFRDRVLHHGTLLFDASLNHMRQSLKPQSDNYSTRGVESNRSSVTNLKDSLVNFENTSEFASYMFDYFKSTFPGFEKFKLTSQEIESITALAELKYKTWEWNWGYGPPYTFTGTFEMSGRKCKCKMMVKDGIIWSCDIEGDTAVAAAGKSLIGARHMFSDILNIFRERNILIPNDEIYKFF